MSKEDTFKTEGQIVSQERNGYWVQHDLGTAFCTASRLRRFKISLVPGDKVLIEFGSYSTEKARILRRL